MKSLSVVVIICALIMIGAAFGHYYLANEQQSAKEASYPNYNVDLYLDGTNMTRTYSVILNNVSNETGTYYQLLSFNMTTYAINQNGSNVLFYASNGTALYAMLESINSGSATYWIKNFDGNTLITLQVFPEHVTEFSDNGYLQKLNMQFSGVSSVTGNEFYADGAVGDYINFTVPDTVTHITYEMETTFLGDTFLFVNSTGYGQMVRLDGRADSPDTGFSTTNSWLSWNAPPSLYQATENTWFKISITELSTPVLWSLNITNETSGITTHVENYTIDPAGHYFGFIGDSAGDGSYWKNVTFYSATGRTINVLPTTVTPMPSLLSITPVTVITKTTVAYPSNKLTLPMSDWLNLTFKAYSTYNFTFTYNNAPLYFSYNGMVNNTLSTGFLDSNLTATLIFIGTSYSGKTNPIILNGGN